MTNFLLKIIQIFGESIKISKIMT